MVIVVFVEFDAVPVKAPVKLVALIFIADKLVMDALDALINDPVIIVLPFAIVVKDTFLNDALNTFINAVDGIEKFPVTERFVKLIFELMVPYGNPFMFVTDKLFMVPFDALINDPVMIVLPFAIVVNDTFVNDALNTFINAVDGIEKFPITERFTTDILFMDALDTLINLFVFNEPTKISVVKVCVIGL